MGGITRMNSTLTSDSPDAVQILSDDGDLIKSTTSIAERGCVLKQRSALRITRACAHLPYDLAFAPSA